jgi:hypothetical protein
MPVPANAERSAERIEETAHVPRLTANREDLATRIEVRLAFFDQGDSVMRAVLYAMLLAMVARAGRTRAVQSRLDPLLLLTSILGLLWNVCALLAYELPKVGFEGPFPLLGAVGFGALGFLPAVVVLLSPARYARGCARYG